MNSDVNKIFCAAGFCYIVSKLQQHKMNEMNFPRAKNRFKFSKYEEVHRMYNSKTYISFLHTIIIIRHVAVHINLEFMILSIENWTQYQTPDQCD